MDAWIIWLVVAALLVGTEILTQMVWTLCLAVGCAAGLALSLCGLDPAWQIAAAGIAAVVAYLALMPVFTAWQRKSAARKDRGCRTGMDALLGRRATVTSEILPGGMGRVRIDGDNWQAVAPGSRSAIARGTVVSVDAYDSIVLTVSELPEPGK